MSAVPATPVAPAAPSTPMTRNETLALYFIAGLGGLVPTLSKMAGYYAANPKEPMPDVGMYVAMGLFFTISLAIQFAFQEKTRRQAFILGITAPAIIAGILQGVNDGRGRPSAALEGIPPFALIASANAQSGPGTAPPSVTDGGKSSVRQAFITFRLEGSSKAGALELPAEIRFMGSGQGLSSADTLWIRDKELLNSGFDTPDLNCRSNCKDWEARSGVSRTYTLSVPEGKRIIPIEDGRGVRCSDLPGRPGGACAFMKIVSGPQYTDQRAEVTIRTWSHPVHIQFQAYSETRVNVAKTIVVRDGIGVVRDVPRDAQSIEVLVAGFRSSAPVPSSSQDVRYEVVVATGGWKDFAWAMGSPRAPNISSLTVRPLSN